MLVGEGKERGKEREKERGKQKERVGEDRRGVRRAHVRNINSTKIKTEPPCSWYFVARPNFGP